MLSGPDVIRVGIDARCLNRPHLRGMGKYVHEVVTRLGGRPFAWELFADRPDLPVHAPMAERLNVHVFECRGYRFHAWEQFALPRRAAKAAVDVLHCPGTRVPWWQPVPTVVTVHDTLPWTQDEPDWPAGFYLNRLLPRAFAKCAAIVTDSECSRRDIVKQWPHLEPKVRVIPLGIGDVYLSAEVGPLSDALRALGVRSPYLLYVGGCIPRKRLDWALRILDGLHAPDVQLVVCGVEPEAEAVFRGRVQPELQARIGFVPFVAEDDMPRLYRHAAAVLYPTLYEGFGFPVLEAQAVGTPVLCSPVGSLPELAGPGTILLPVDDLAAWTGTCEHLLAEGRMTSDAEARAWARRFSWERCATRLAEVYRCAAGRPSTEVARNGRSLTDEATEVVIRRP